jgi:hypothetical protein
MDASIAITLMVLLFVITFGLGWCLYRMNVEIPTILDKAGMKDKIPFYVLTLYAVTAWITFLFCLAIIWMG